MRSENDKKNFKTSVKMTQSDHELLEQRARKCGKKIGPYIVETAVKADKSITPETVAKLQNIVNYACEAVKETSRTSIRYCGAFITRSAETHAIMFT